VKTNLPPFRDTEHSSRGGGLCKTRSTGEGMALGKGARKRGVKKKKKKGNAVEGKEIPTGDLLPGKGP